MDNKAFGKQLLDIRTMLGLSQSEVADISGVSQPYLSQLERGLFSPNITVVLRLAKALRVPVGHLLQSEKENEKRRCS